VDDEGRGGHWTGGCGSGAAPAGPGKEEAGDVYHPDVDRSHRAIADYESGCVRAVFDLVRVGEEGFREVGVLCQPNCLLFGQTSWRDLRAELEVGQSWRFLRTASGKHSKTSILTIRRLRRAVSEALVKDRQSVKCFLLDADDGEELLAAADVYLHVVAGAGSHEGAADGGSV